MRVNQRIGCICIVNYIVNYIDPVIGTLKTADSFTHCCAWPADGRSVLHIERSWPAIQAAPTDRPMSSSTCCSQFLRGRPGGRFQSAAGGVPVWASIDSCSACEAGVFSGRQYNDITSNFAEERISVCIAASSTNGARQSASETMQAAKKVVLVDEFDREYKRLQKSADAVAKTNSSLHLSTLQSQSLRRPESETVAYVAALHKYINTRAELMGGLLKPIYSDTTQLNSTRRRVELSCVAINGFLHSIQRGGASAGCGPAHSPHRCTKCNSPPINGQHTNFILFDVAL